MLTQQLVSGLAIGAVYALMALGYTLVYGILKFINFAHGAVYMVGAYVGLGVVLLLTPRWPLAAAVFCALLVAMAACALLGMLIEKVAYRPLRRAGRLTSFLTSLGVSMALTYGMEVAVTPLTRPMPQLFEGMRIELGSATITYLQIMMFGVSLLLMVALQLFVWYTKPGKAIRATSENLVTASLMGISLDRILSLTFALGSALAAVAGVMVGMYYSAVYPTMGWTAGLKGFISAVLGGIGSIPGAVLGGFILGLAENLGAAYVASGYRDIIAFTVLTAIMLVRPEGLLSPRSRSR